MKTKTGISIDSNLLAECDEWCKNNSLSRSELIEQALKLFLATRTIKDKTDILVPELAKCIAKASDDGITKISKGLFRYAVEVEMLIEILSESFDVTEDKLYEIRRRAVNNVRRTRGRIKLDDLITGNTEDKIESDDEYYTSPTTAQ